MIQSFKQIPVTATSHPQATARGVCHLDARGYVEEEYFMEGTANVYERDGDRAIVRYADAPYVNRLLVRRPADPAKASGRVVVEILNATSAKDIDRMWVLTHELFLRNGDIWVGITSKPSSICAMQKLAPERYAPLHWTNPEPRYLPQFLRERHEFCGPIRAESETGLFWDMLTDTAHAIRSGALPLGSKINYVYLIGWSQSTIYMVQYLNYFAYRDGGKSPFDGYFSGGGVRSLAPALNQYAIPECAGEYGTILHRVSEPYIAVQTESENSALGNEVVRQPDSDDPNFKYRIYDVPGATHDCQQTMQDYYRDDPDQYALGIVLAYPAKDALPNNYPSMFAFHRGCDMMYRWAEQDEVPIRMPRIEVGFNDQNVRDFDGNAIGGWRLPAIDVPVCMYYPFPDQLQPSVFSLYGARYPFPPEKLLARYGSLADLRAAVEQSAKQAVADGRLMAEDYDACVAFSVGEAARYGLC